MSRLLVLATTPFLVHSQSTCVDLKNAYSASTCCDSAVDTTPAMCPHGCHDMADVCLIYDPGGKGDNSFNDAAHQGYSRAQQSFGANVIDKEILTSFESNKTQALYTQSFHCKSIFAVGGFVFGNALAAVYPLFPTVTYTLGDSKYTAFDTISPTNVRGAAFATHEGTFLTGALAALKSTTNKLGFIGGFNVPIIDQFRAGFVAGAKHVNPSIQIHVAFVNHPMFNDPDTAKSLALQMYEQGCDVIQHVSGTSGSGVFEAAANFSASNNTHVWALGVDSDQYMQVSDTLKPFILSSILKRMDTAVFNWYTQQASFQNFVSGEYVYNLANDGVGYATSGGQTDEFTAQLTALKNDIVAGTIVVPSNTQA